MLLKTRIPFKYIIKKIKFEIIYVLIIGFLVFYLTRLYRAEIPIMPIAIPTFLGTAISVILSFKLSQSYDRWWEARKIWGSIVNESRNFVLQLQSFVTAGNENIIKTIAYRQIAWSFSLGQTLRGQSATDNLDKFISETDFTFINKHHNKQLALLQLNTLAIAELKNNSQLDLFSQVQINNTLVNLTNALGMAERIKNTVFPVTYRYFLHLIIYLFVITLSISLRDIESYFEIPLLLVISCAFFLLEKTATDLQDPFNNQPTDTPVTAIATTIEINIKQLLNETDLPEPIKGNDFHLS